MPSAPVSLYVRTFHKMPILGKVEGTLAACMLVGFHLSSVMGTQRLMLHGHFSCCRRHSSPFIPSSLFILLLFVFFQAEEKLVKRCLFWEKNKEVFSGIVKKKKMQLTTKIHFKKIYRGSIEVFPPPPKAKLMKTAGDCNLENWESKMNKTSCFLLLSQPAGDRGGG